MQKLTMLQELSTHDRDTKQANAIGKNGTNRFAGCWVATNLQFQQNVISVKCNKISTIK